MLSVSFIQRTQIDNLAFFMKTLTAKTNFQHTKIDNSPFTFILPLKTFHYSAFLLFFSSKKVHFILTHTSTTNLHSHFLRHIFPLKQDM